MTLYSTSSYKVTGSGKPSVSEAFPLSWDMLLSLLRGCQLVGVTFQKAVTQSLRANNEIPIVFKTDHLQPWMVWLSWLGTFPQTEKSLV